jgi:hypothetical protein
MGQGDIANLEAALTNLRYDAAVLAEALATIDVASYITNVTREELLGLLAP